MKTDGLNKLTVPFAAFACLPSGSSKSVSEDNWDSASLWTQSQLHLKNNLRFRGKETNAKEAFK